MATKKAKTPATEKKTPRTKPAIAFAPMKFKDYTITQKNSGRYEVVNNKGFNVNGTEKEKLLLEAKVLTGSFKKAAKEEATTT